MHATDILFISVAAIESFFFFFPHCRAELIAFYDNLSKQAEQREIHAYWIIQRYELAEKRRLFLKTDQEKNEAELSEYLLRNVKHGNQDGSTPVIEDVMADVLDIVDGTAHSAEDSTIRLIADDISRNVSDAGIVASSSGIDKTLIDKEDALTVKVKTTRTMIENISEEATHSNIQNHSDAKSVIYPDSNRAATMEASFKKRIALQEKQSAEQTQSVAKYILYPDEESGISSAYRDQFQGNLEDLPQRIPLGSSAFEGSSTKDILYPVNPVNPVRNPSPQNVEGAETKILIYPGEHLVDITPLQPRRSAHPEEGAETKDLLYPKDFVPESEFTSSRGVTNDEGKETKALLYPKDFVPDSEFTSSRGVTNDEGKETKALLYPKDFVPESEFISSRGVTNDEGKETKALLYPKDFVPDSEFTSSRGVTNDEGKETKALLYPKDFVPESEFISSRGVTNDEGKETKALLYPKDFVPDSEFTSSRGVTNDEGKETKALLYPKDFVPESEFISSRGVTNDEGKETKALLYPKYFVPDSEFTSSRGVTNDEGKETKALLYPKDFVPDSEFTSTRGATNVEGRETKALLYPHEQFDNITSLRQGRLGLTQKGDETKNLLYPQDMTDNIIFKSSRGTVKEEGMETKHLLYPVTQQEIIDVNRHKSKHIEGEETKNILYPGEGQVVPHIQSSWGMKIEGEEAKNIMYPDQMKQDVAQIKHSVPYSEGLDTKSLFYPTTADGIYPTDHVVRNFEKASVMQMLLYPDGKEQLKAEEIKKLRKGFEPPTTIKNMMYPQHANTG